MPKAKPNKQGKSKKKREAESPAMEAIANVNSNHSLIGEGRKRSVSAANRVTNSPKGWSRTRSGCGKSKIVIPAEQQGPAELENEFSDQTVEFEEDGKIINMQIKVGKEDANEFASEEESELEKDSESESEESENPSETESSEIEHQAHSDQDGEETETELSQDIDNPQPSTSS